jgi:hypothetical protein
MQLNAAAEQAIPLKRYISKVKSLFLPQRASEWKLGKSLKPHLAKQTKQELEETWNRCTSSVKTRLAEPRLIQNIVMKT